MQSKIKPIVKKNPKNNNKILSPRLTSFHAEITLSNISNNMGAVKASNTAIQTTK